MKPAVTTRSRRLNFNITPMIDVVFQLIIFFLAASHLARIQSSEEVSLPTATQGQDVEPQRVRQVVVTVTKDRGAFLSGQPIDVMEFEHLLVTEENGENAGEHVEVLFRLDEHGAWGKFDPFLVACARAGVTQVVFKVLPR